MAFIEEGRVVSLHSKAWARGGRVAAAARPSLCVRMAKAAQDIQGYASPQHPVLHGEQAQDDLLVDGLGLRGVRVEWTWRLRPQRGPPVHRRPMHTLTSSVASKPAASCRSFPDTVPGSARRLTRSMYGLLKRDLCHGTDSSAS
jgi:hypothetical protein